MRHTRSGRRKLVMLAVPGFVLALGALLFLQTVPQAAAPSAAVRAGIDDASVAVTAPMDRLLAALPLIGAGHRARERIAELEIQTRELAYWRETARIMSERLTSYERILGLTGERPEYGVAARIVAEQNGPFSATGIANAGHRQGVADGYAAIGWHGLVGRVVRTGSRTSRILLLTDQASHIPVMGTRSHDRAILVGDGKSAARLRHAETPHGIQDGELWITSGDAGLLPRGLGVGVARKDAHGWHIDLAMNKGGLDFVRLVPPSYFPPPDNDTP